MYIQVVLVLRKYKYNLKNENICYIWYSKITSHINYITCPNISIYKLPMMSSKTTLVVLLLTLTVLALFALPFFVPFTSYFICVAYRLGSHYTHFLVNSVNHVYKIFSEIEWPCKISVFGGILCHSHLWLIQKYSASLWLYRNGTEDHLQLK